MKTSIPVYRRLIAVSRPYAGRIALAMFASLGVAGADVVSARLIQPLVDHILAARNLALVPWVPAIIISLTLFKAVSRYIQEYHIKTAGQLVVQDIRNDLFTHSITLSMGFFNRTSAGAMMSRVLNDVSVMQRSTADVLVDAVRESFTLVGLTGLVFYTDWRLAAVAFLVLPVAVIPSVNIGQRIKEYTRRSQRSMGNLTGILQESYSGVKVVKAFGTEKEENRRFRKENRAFYKLMRKALRYDAATTPIIELLASLGIAAVFWFGLHRVLSGGMSQGELLSFITAMLMMYSPVKKLTKMSNTFQRSIGAAERVFEIMDEVPDITDIEAPVELETVRGVVEFDGVSFSYGEEPVLRDFNLKVRAGEVIALVGPSGAGKTTVAALLMRFFDPEHGTLRIDGHDLRRISLASLKKNLALVDQEAFLFNHSVRDNIRYGRLDADDASVEEAARQAFADEFIRQMPAGYDTQIGDRGLRLSGGQRQRLCIARAILRDAPILILDEATSALDSASEAKVQEALANLMRNRTTFVIAHRLSTVMHADRIVVMEGGRITDIGNHQELLSREGLYQKLYRMQFQAEQ